MKVELLHDDITRLTMAPSDGGDEYLLAALVRTFLYGGKITVQSCGIMAPCEWTLQVRNKKRPSKLLRDFISVVER